MMMRLPLIAALMVSISPAATRADDPGAKPAAPARPEVVAAGEWGSKPKPIPAARKHTPKFVTIHHAGVTWKAAVTPEAFVRNMQAWGQTDKGWPDLPYHFLIAPDGRIFEGRPLEYEPESNTKYPLAGNIGVELMGNFEEQRPDPRQVAACVKLTAWLCGRYGIDPATVRGHKDAAKGQTSCPGKDFDRYLRDGQLHRWVRAAVEGKDPAIDLGPPLPGGPTEPIPSGTPKG